ncbi:hypothetical protein CW712_00465 [Candidatus Bathyarchaeota archaeon]|nr:MAG: hypothetical protein CW712_00465 [Candidatus Bathyarchaeota archaeon]
MKNTLRRKVGSNVPLRKNRYRHNNHGSYENPAEEKTTLGNLSNKPVHDGQNHPKDKENERNPKNIYKENFFSRHTAHDKQFMGLL